MSTPAATPPVVVQAIGECMIEVARAGGSVRLDYSGDTFNTAVYLRRSAADGAVPLEVRYLSGLGSDPESDLMRRRWQAHGVESDAIAVSGRGPGLYLITTDQAGERTFSYWRDRSAAAALFATTDWIDHVRGDFVFLSGITLQLTTPESRRLLCGRLAELRRRGTTVVFDSNYRPSAWASPAAALAAMDEVLAVTDIALVTWDDERERTGCSDVESCVRRLQALGVREIVVKQGAIGAWIVVGGEPVLVPAVPVDPVDTTAAGDSFNGAYLAARIGGASEADAAAAGNALAALVIQAPGAIVATERAAAPE